MVVGRRTHNCTASRSTGFEDMAGNTPWGADNPVRLAARHPEEARLLLAVVVAVVAVAAAAAAAAVVVVVAAVGAQVNP